MSSLAQSARVRWVTFGVIVVALAALTGIFVIRAISDQQKMKIPTGATVRDQALDLGAVLDVPHIIFRSTALGPTYGLLAAVPLSDPGGDRSVSNLSCDRVYADAAAGICLAAERGAITTYSAQLLNARMQRARPLDISGIPSRARLSPDGVWAATTAFVSGHAYTSINFSTQTSITGVSNGISYQDLEKSFSTLIDGVKVTSKDLNVWGVTFSPSSDSEFYATVATGGKTWLARGDLRTRSLTAIRANAECPSIAPDGRHIVYKKRTGSRITWRYAVLDLDTGVERPLAEARSIDDQAEWLDDTHVLYGLQRPDSGESDIWVAGIGPDAPAPTVYLPDAWSPAVVRDVT